jgi:hypothetical protein
MEATERRLVITEMSARPIRKRSNAITMRDPEAGPERITSTTCPTSFVPARIRACPGSGTFCMLDAGKSKVGQQQIS